MSTISTTKATNLRRILFTLDKRRTLRLGDVDMRTARAIQGHVDALVTQATHGHAIPDATAGWLKQIGDKLHGRLVACGLTSPRKHHAVATCEQICDALMNRRTDWKPTTRRKYTQGRAELVNHFGDRDVTTITVAEAKDCRRAMRTRLAEATVASHMQCIRKFFSDAVDRGVMSESPFASVEIGSFKTSRTASVPIASLELLIEKAPTPEWKAIIALCRYAGLRVPSELWPLTWGDVDFAKGVLRIASPKTAGQGKPFRLVPLFTPLAAVLAEVKASVKGKSTDRIAPSYRHSANLATQLRKIIKRAGLQPWTRLFHSIRATRQAELSRQFDMWTACEWMGNSTKVAQQSYLKASAEDFARAAGKSDAHSDAVSNGMGPYATDHGRIVKKTTLEMLPENANRPQNAGDSTNEKVVEGGVETRRIKDQKQHDRTHRYVKSDARSSRRNVRRDAQTNRLCAAIHRLSGPVRLSSPRGAQ